MENKATSQKNAAQYLQVGLVIRKLRRERKMTGEDLAKKTGFSQSRISKIETGMLTKPKPEEIKKILNILEPPETIRQQILMALNVEETVRLHRHQLNYPYLESLEYERRARSIKVYSASLIPALLQTAEYRLDLLKGQDLAPEAFQLAMQTVLKRQDLLWEKGRRYHFILQEAALYTLIGDRRIQLAQLDRLDRMVGQYNMRLGVIPTQAGLLPLDISSFVSHDDRRVFLVTATSDIFITRAEEVNTYCDVFQGLEKRSEYGEAARDLIHRAIDYFS